MHKVRDENQHYDAWLQWFINYQCNLNCVYCFQHSDRNQRLFKKITGIFSLKLVSKIKKAFKLRPHALLQIIHYKLFGIKQTIRINIPALVNTLNTANKTFRVGFAGGEPFLVPNIIEACAEITKKHFVSLNTNLVTKKAEEFAERIDPKRVLFIVASLHIEQLERHRLVERYINTFLEYQKKGFNIIAETVAYPSLLDKAIEYKVFFKEKGITMNFNPFLGDYNGQHYPEAYSDEELRIFGLDNACRVDNYQQDTACNVGYNVVLVMPNGTIYLCHHLHEEMGNIYKGIKFRDKLVTCPVDFCQCPLKIYDPYLFEKACFQTGAKGQL